MSDSPLRKKVTGTAAVSEAPARRKRARNNKTSPTPALESEPATTRRRGTDVVAGGQTPGPRLQKLNDRVFAIVAAQKSA